MHRVPFGHSNVVMLFWDAEKCRFLLGSVGEDPPSQQSSDCLSTSPSPEVHSGFWVLFPHKSCSGMGGGGVLAGVQWGTWQGEGRGRRARRCSSQPGWERKQENSVTAASHRARPGLLSRDTRTRDNKRRRLYPTALKIHGLPQPRFLVLPVFSLRGNSLSTSSSPGSVPRPCSCSPPSSAHLSAAPQGQATFTH